MATSATDGRTEEGGEASLCQQPRRPGRKARTKNARTAHTGSNEETEPLLRNFQQQSPRSDRVTGEVGETFKEELTQSFSNPPPNERTLPGSL